MHLTTTMVVRCGKYAQLSSSLGLPFRGRARPIRSPGVGRVEGKENHRDASKVMTRPSAPLISLDGAVRATLDVIERDGLEKLTLRTLATHLGVSAPSIYHHFANKTELLFAAAKELVKDVPPPRVSSLDDWKGWFRSMAMNVYKHVMQRPRASALLVENFPHAMVFPFRNRASELLFSAGIPPAEVVTIIRSFEKLTFGLILADATEGLSGKRDWADVPEDRFHAYRAALNAMTLDTEKALITAIDIFLEGVSAKYLSG
jgi:TetR/AcrR family transcriptional regulator, tetracycline repressor protein